MGYSIKIIKAKIKLKIKEKELFELFHKKQPSGQIKGKYHISFETEQGGISVWYKKTAVLADIATITGIGYTKTIYSRNGRWVLDTITNTVQNYKGNLLLITREPDTGGGSTTVIYQGELILGIFSEKLGSPYGYNSIWKDDYKKELDIDKPTKTTIVTLKDIQSRTKHGLSDDIKDIEF
jgi:hypothetical protein